jgi:hypothetical protein
MGATGRVDTRQTHRHSCEPAHLDAGRKYLLVRTALSTLGGDRDGVPPVGKNVPQIKDMALLPADVWREELRYQQKTHYLIPHV